MRVLRHKRIRFIFHPVTTPVKEVGRAWRAENVIVWVIILITESQFIVPIDIPVDTS